MSWYEEVTKYINNHLEDFAEKFYSGSKIIRYGSGITINPAPCCGHNDCFSFLREGSGFNCFSCGETGTKIQALEITLGQDAARRALEDWTGIRYTSGQFDEKRQKALQAEKRIKELHELAIEHYHTNLFKTPGALMVQMGSDQKQGQRAHTKETIIKYKVGLSGRYKEFYDEMLAKGYSDEELKEASKLIWAPEGYFIYPYYDVKGNLVRINTKLYIRYCMGKRNKKEGTYSGDCDFKLENPHSSNHAILAKSHETTSGHEMMRDGFSRGQRESVFYFAKGNLRNKRKVILVEGENDTSSSDEELVKLPSGYQKDFVVIGLGGNPKEETFSGPFLRQFEAIYEAFDNDEVGDKYRQMLNEYLPDVPVYSIRYDPDFNDIDSYIKSAAYRSDFKELLDRADFVDTKAYVIERENNSHTWLLRNRKYQLEFMVETFNRNANQLEGILLIYKNGQLADKKIGGIDKMKVDQSILYAKLELSEHLNDYYNNVQWEKDKPKRSLWELMDILRFSKEYSKIIKQIAWYLHHAEGIQYEITVKQLQKKMNQQIVAEILQEVNGFQNVELNPDSIFPRISLSQYFHVSNNDAFFYFSKLVKEGDTAKLVPCLISNKKEEIRLDLLRRKDEQCLLLIQNKYELPFEVKAAVMDPVEVSLQPYWVNKWKNDELDPEDYKPAKLVKEIEDFISATYYIKEDALKVLALWIYATYFYMLFTSGFPYLMFTGAKGTGKSTIDTIIYLLSLNAKFALDMSESALFRTISFEGGTFILDEVENLTDKKTVDSSGYAKILKGGYADLAYVYRTNQEKGVTERFSVFGPKVISNINGIEHVIADRCIYIKTYSVPEEKLGTLVDPQVFKRERRSEAHSITSRCAISALSYFKEVNDIFYNMDSRLQTGNARLSQIMRPLLTMARFVGGDYEKHLMNFYDKEVKTAKDEIASSTLDGLLKNILKRTAEELTGIEREKWATDPDKHLYEAPIRYSPDLGGFEMDQLHLKVLCEEMNSGEIVEIKDIMNALKNVLGSEFDFKNNKQRTTITISDEALQRQLGGKRHLRVYRFFFNVKDFIDAAKISTYLSKPKAESSLF